MSVCWFGFISCVSKCVLDWWMLMMFGLFSIKTFNAMLMDNSFIACGFLFSVQFSSFDIWAFLILFSLYIFFFFGSAFKLLAAFRMRRRGD